MTETTEGMERSQRPRRLARRCMVSVIDGPDAGRRFSANGSKIIIGTHESADFVLTDRTVSRFHCELSLGAHDIRLRDLNSRNGSWVNDVRVTTGCVGDGQILTLGESRMRVDLDMGHNEVPTSERAEFGLLVGRSPVMRSVFSILEKAASSDVTVLIHGETGTGKEITAESIHRESARAGGPFIFVDCAAIPAKLLESELFGHEKGAFTGATSAREGAFVAAHGGTIFLDEIGELDADLQPRLLRVLERKHVKPLGTDHYRDVDVRVLAATNRDLRAAVNQKRFRSDLYYRLAVIEIELPPLRERLEDLPILVEHLLARRVRDGSVARPAADELTSQEFVAHLAGHSWPGNIRELRNYLERCLAMRERMPFGPALESADRDAGRSAAHAAALFDTTVPLKQAREQWNQALEHQYLAAVLERNQDNVSAAAREAGVDRTHFHRMLRRHGLR